jgi:hypothetical protein
MTISHFQLKSQKGPPVGTGLVLEKIDEISKNRLRRPKHKNSKKER